MDKIIKQRFLDHLEVANAVMQSNIMGQIQIVAEEIKKALAEGHKVLFCGNGGSAADSQHLAAEFVGRFQKERRGLPAIALTVDTSILTAVGNDYGYDKVFVRQVEALAQTGDVLVGISTSGNSANVVEAIELPDAPFVLGVQWHPEKMMQAGDEASRRLFEAFAEAARR